MRLATTILKALGKATLLSLVFVAAYITATKMLEFPFENPLRPGEYTKIVVTDEEIAQDGSTPETVAIYERTFDEAAILPIPEKQTYKRLVLGKKNTATFREVFNAASVSALQLKILQMDATLPRNKPIFLVLDTPGGSVDAGNTLIDMINSLNRPVHTVTLFSASMGFHTVQSLGRRLITPSGTLMSHRIRIGGLRGEVPGNAVTRMNDILRLSQVMDIRVSERMGMSLDYYQELIRDEFWVNGQDAVEWNAADDVVRVTCGRDLNGTYEQDMMTFFGPLKLTWSECPLVRFPVGIDFSGLWIFGENVEVTEGIAQKRAEIRKFVHFLVYDKRRFVREYITNGEIHNILE